jgi:hypothetical protein
LPPLTHSKHQSTLPQNIKTPIAINQKCPLINKTIGTSKGVTQPINKMNTFIRNTTNTLISKFPTTKSQRNRRRALSASTMNKISVSTDDKKKSI